MTSMFIGEMWRIWQKKVPLRLRAASSSPCRMQCSESSWITGTRCSHTSLAKCASTTSASFLRIALESSFPHTTSLAVVSFTATSKKLCQPSYIQISPAHRHMRHGRVTPGHVAEVAYLRPRRPEPAAEPLDNDPPHSG